MTSKEFSMSRIASRLQRVKPSPSSAAQDRANELRRAGKDIVNMVIGEPDFDTPWHVRESTVFFPKNNALNPPEC